MQAEDGIRDLVRSRGLGDVYKRQVLVLFPDIAREEEEEVPALRLPAQPRFNWWVASILSLIHI